MLGRFQRQELPVTLTAGILGEGCGVRHGEAMPGLTMEKPGSLPLCGERPGVREIFFCTNAGKKVA